MGSDTHCPTCATELMGLARWCHVCARYVEDMGPDNDPPPASAAKPVPVVDDRSEAEIQLGIRRALELVGYHVSDLSQDRPTRQTPGIPDLFVMGHGRFAWMEVKRPKGRVSEHQRAWHALAQKNGVPCIVVRSEAEAMAWHEERKAA